jgi:hypothetical protein
MLKLTRIFILIFIIALTGCKTSTAPALIPTEIQPASSVTIRPSHTPIPSLNLTEILDPKTILKPTSIITFTTSEITETLPTRNRAVLVWSVEGKRERYLGIVDFSEAVLYQLRPTIKYYDPASLPGITWSPSGTQFMYRSLSVEYDFGISVFNVDDSTEAHFISLGAPAAFCEWAPLDGRYLVCFDYCSHEPYSRTIFDARQWRTICRDFGSFACGLSGSETCPSLSLADGTMWVTSEKRPEFVHPPTLAPTQDSADRKVNALVTKFCRNSERVGGCQQSTINPNKRFVAVVSNHNLFVLGEEQDNVWYLSNEVNQSSWSADSRHLAWIENDQVRLFDTITHTITAYKVPDAQMLNIAWSPLQ